MISSVLYVCTNDNLKQMFVFSDVKKTKLRKHCTNIIFYKTIHNRMCLIKLNFTIIMIFYFVNILTFHYYNSYLDQSSLFQRKKGASHLRAEHKEEVNITPKTEN